MIERNGSELENAIEHSESSTSIQVDIAKDSKWITITIKDQGTGIQENIKPLITQRFFTYNKNEQSQVKGTGLGLYLVDSIVKLYQGKLSFLPNEPKGTCVKIEIPLSDESLPKKIQIKPRTLL